MRASLWALEQALRCPTVGAVLGWPGQIIDKNIRRLQLAAEAGGCLGILYRPAAAAHETSPAALRLQLTSGTGIDTDQPSIELHKVRGGRAGQRFQVQIDLRGSLQVTGWQAHHPASQLDPEQSHAPISTAAK